MRRPRVELGPFRLEGGCAIQLRQRRSRGPSGDRTLDERGLKVRRSAAELTARRYQRPDLFTHQRSPLVGHRPAVARVSIELTTSALWARRSEPTELSRHGWPPRNRTARYLRIRQAPSTSWVVASRWRRSRPPALARPSGFKPEPATRFPAGDHHLVVSSPSEESGRLERHGATRASVSNGARHPGRFTLHERRARDRRTARYVPTCAVVLPRLTTCPTRDSNSEPLPSEGSASTKLG